MSEKLRENTAQVAWGPSEVKSHLTSTKGPNNWEEGSSLAQQPGKSEGKSQSKSCWERRRGTEGKRERGRELLGRI